jgi:hypothetical protein
LLGGGRGRGGRIEGNESRGGRCNIAIVDGIIADAGSVVVVVVVVDCVVEVVEGGRDLVGGELDGHQQVGRGGRVLVSERSRRQGAIVGCVGAIAAVVVLFLIFHLSTVLNTL